MPTVPESSIPNLLKQVIKSRHERRRWERRGRLSQIICIASLLLTLLSMFVKDGSFFHAAHAISLGVISLSWMYGWYCIHEAAQYAKFESDAKKKLDEWEDDGEIGT